MIFFNSVLALCLVAQQDGTPPGHALPRAIHDAFVSNQKAFPFGRISFDYVKGNAASDTDARDGRFDPAYRASCSYAFNGHSAKYERVFSDDDMVKANKMIGNDIVTIIDTVRMATNGELTLYDSTTVAEKTKARGTKLVPGTRDFERDFKFPLSLGRPDCRSLDNLGRRLLNALEGGTDERIIVADASLDYEGRKVARVKLVSSTDEIDYWIDLERGAIPLRIIDRVAPRANVAGFQVIYYLDDIRLTPGRGWLPYRESWWYGYNGQGGQIVVSEAVFDEPPDDSAFVLEFPEAISLVDSAKGLRYPARRNWNILHLPRANALGIEKVEYASIPADRVPAQPGELPAPPRFHLLIYGMIGLLLLVLALVWRRRSRHGWT